MNIHDKAKEARDNNIPLIDVRSEKEFEEYHLEGAVNIPLSQIEKADVEDGSYIYCRSGSRSQHAVNLLEKRNIKALNIGGIENEENK